MKVLLLIFAFLTAAFASPVLAQGRWHGQGPRFDPATCDPWLCTESGWIYDDTSTDHTTVWRHNMRWTPRKITILFSPDPEAGPVYPLMWPWQWQTTGNPQGLEMDNRAVRMHIWSGAPLHGVWRPGQGWSKWHQGYWKIIVYR